jgi:hypothetical protein
MAEAVYDASFIAYANCSLDDPTDDRRDFLGQLVAAIGLAVSGQARIRWNKALRAEYDDIVKVQHNDLVDQFFAILTGENATFVARNSLRRHENARAQDCNWPQHDRHLIAAAIEGKSVTIHVTERRLGQCTKKVWQVFRIRVNYVPVVLP